MPAPLRVVQTGLLSLRPGCGPAPAAHATAPCQAPPRRGEAASDSLGFPTASKRAGPLHTDEPAPHGARLAIYFASSRTPLNGCCTTASQASSCSRRLSFSSCSPSLAPFRSLGTGRPIGLLR